MKYSTQFEEDYQFYLTNMEKFTFCGENVSEWPNDPAGKDAKYCFFKFDSCGKKIPSNEGELVRNVLICKKSINWHIKQYAEGIVDGCFTVKELMEAFTNPPEWVEKAIRNQVKKIYFAKRKDK